MKESNRSSGRVYFFGGGRLESANAPRVDVVLTHTRFGLVPGTETRDMAS